MIHIEPDGFIAVTFVHNVFSRNSQQYILCNGLDQLEAARLFPDCDVDTTTANCYTLLNFNPIHHGEFYLESIKCMLRVLFI